MKQYLVLFALLSAYISGQWTRFSLAYLSGVAISECTKVCKAETLPLCEAEPGSSLTCDSCYINATADKYNLKQGTCLTEREYSLLVSYGFIAFFAACGLFAGRFADQYNRKNLVSIAAIGWGIATLVQSSAHNFATLLVARIMMGLFTSFSAPASYSILADTFPMESLATANGIYSLGVYLGGGLSSLSIVLAHSVGWRMTSSIIAIFGLLSGIACFCIPEPERKGRALLTAQENENGKKKSYPTLIQAFKITFSDYIVVLVILAASTRFLGGFALGAYLPQFYKRKFPDQNSEYSIINAVVVSIAGGISSILGGRIADKTEAKYGAYACGLIPAIGSLAGVVPIIGTLHVDDFHGSVFLLFVSYLLVECWFGPALKIIQSRIPKESRALAISVYLFCGSMIGNISPVIIGWVDDGSTVDSIVNILSLFLVISYVGSAILFLVVSLLTKKYSTMELLDSNNNNDLQEQLREGDAGGSYSSLVDHDARVDDDTHDSSDVDSST